MPLRLYKEGMDAAFGSVDIDELNTNRVWDSSGRAHGELTGTNDAQVVIDAIADRTGDEAIIIPDPGFALDWEQQVDIPATEHGFSLETIGLPILSIPSDFTGSSAIRKPDTTGAFRGYRGYRIGGFSFDDSNQVLDWAINLSNVKESVIHPSIFRDCPAIRIHSNDGYSNQNKIYGPLIKSDQGRGPGILLDNDPDTGITADQNWIYSPSFSDGGNSTETAYVDRGKHNSWIYTRVEYALICHSQEPQDPNDGTYGRNYYISSGGWDRSGDFRYTVIERGEVRGTIERVYGNLDYDKLQLSSPSTTVRHVGAPKADGSNRSSNASNLLHDLSDITPVQNFESVGIQDTSDANSSVSYNFPYFTRPRLHFDTAADETASIDLGSGALDDAGCPKATQSFFPRGSTGPSGVVARWGYFVDSSNRAELVYDPDNVLGGHGTTTWYLEVENGGTVEGSIDLGTTPDDRQFLTLNHREDEWGNRHWSATTDQGAYEDIQTTRLGTGTWRWLIRSVDGTQHEWAMDTSMGATLWRR